MGLSIHQIPQGLPFKCVAAGQGTPGPDFLKAFFGIKGSMWVDNKAMESRMPGVLPCIYNFVVKWGFLFQNIYSHTGQLPACKGFGNSSSIHYCPTCRIDKKGTLGH